MSPRISTPAARAAATAGCGSGKLCGMPGDSTNAATARQSICAGAHKVTSPATAVRVLALSSQASTSAPPASSAAAAARPERARPSTATLRPSKPGTRIIAAYRNFNVASPAIARMAAMIQKRMTMVGSDQPFCSKWWCSGAMRKTRRAGQFEARHLDDDRHRLQHEQPADDGQHQLVLGDDADRAERAAQATASRYRP